MEKLVVYYDNTYTTAWIDIGLSKHIAKFLKNRDFVIMNANELREWMINIIECRCFG